MAESLIAWNSRRSPRGSRDQPHLGLAALDLPLLGLLRLRKRRQLAAQVDDVLVAIHPVVEQRELLDQFALGVGNRRPVHGQFPARRQRVPSGPSRMTMPVGNQFVPDAIGGGKILALPRRQPLGQQALDGLGRQAAVALGALEPGLRILAQQAQQAAARPAAGQQVPGARRELGAIDAAGQVEEHGQRLRRVEIVVQGRNELGIRLRRSPRRLTGTSRSAPYSRSSLRLASGSTSPVQSRGCR